MSGGRQSDARDSGSEALHDTWAIQGWLGHRSIISTAVYTALAPSRFKDFWRN
jgi:site-specific recombinase XerD